MDPNEAFATVRDPDADLSDRIDAATDLIGWIDCGGFAPEQMTPRERALVGAVVHFTKLMLDSI